MDRFLLFMTWLFRYHKDKQEEAKFLGQVSRF